MERDHVAAVAGRFSEDAPLYERFWAASMARLGQRLLAGLPLDDASVAVDIGAGVGALLPAIREAAPRAFVAGVDAAEGMIRRAPRDFGRAVMDAGRMALRDASVDAAVMPFMLFFLPDPPRGLAEARRVLRPGGGLGVATWEAESNDVRADGVWADVLDEHGAASDPAPWRLGLMDTPEKVAGLLEEAGFRDVRHRHRPGTPAHDPRGVPRGAHPHRPVEAPVRVARSRGPHRGGGPGQRAAGRTRAGGLH